MLGKPTNKTNFTYFKNDTGTYKQSLYNDISYAKSKGYKDVYISEMTPKEYMEACAKYVFEVPLEDVYDGIMEKENIKKYADMMKSGIKFDMPYIDIKTKQQEGRHRALAAEMLGANTIPVLVLV